MTESLTQQGLEPIEVSELNSSGNSLLNSSSVNGKQFIDGGKQFTPVSRREFATANGVTPAYVGKLVKQLQAVWEPLDQQFQILTADDKITSEAQSELLKMMAQKPAKYQKRVWSEYGYDPKAKPQVQSQPSVSSSSALAVAPSALSRFSQWEKAISNSQSRVEVIDVEFVDSQTSQTNALDTYSQARERIERLQAAATRNRETSNATYLNQVAADSLELKAQADQLRELILSGQLDASALAAMGLANTKTQEK